jgi:hypothetical protein
LHSLPGVTGQIHLFHVLLPLKVKLFLLSVT